MLLDGKEDRMQDCGRTCRIKIEAVRTQKDSSRAINSRFVQALDFLMIKYDIDFTFQGIT
jgi:hypothetical protein